MSAARIQKSDSLYISYQDIQKGTELGQGCFGTVYLGEWQHVTVAIKELAMQRLPEQAQHEFEQEAAVMRELRHPNVILLYGICLEPKKCLVMEYCGSGSLYDFLQRATKIDWSLHTQLAVDIAKGLNYLHNKQILHRDLKSLNVLIDRHMCPKIADFGLSRVKMSSNSNRTLRGKMVGTIRWMAPEIMDDEESNEYTKASDIYSYGMIVWELSTCKIPFEKVEKETLVVTRILQGKREKLPADTPAALVKVTTECWKQNPKDRLSLDEVIKTLKTAQESLPASSSSGYQGELATQTSYSSSSSSSSDYAGGLMSEVQVNPQISFSSSYQGGLATQANYFSSSSSSSGYADGLMSAAPSMKPSYPNNIASAQGLHSNSYNAGNYTDGLMTRPSNFVTSKPSKEMIPSPEASPITSSLISGHISKATTLGERNEALHSITPISPKLTTPLKPIPSPKVSSSSSSSSSSISTVVSSPKVIAPSIPDIAFGKFKWNKYFGDIGVEPPLPANIEQILNSPCPFWPSKRVRETHLLVLIPEKVNGKAFHLNNLSKLIQSPKRSGHKTRYAEYSGQVEGDLGTKSLWSHWVLMTKDVIPESRNKSYEDQEALVQKHAQISKTSYEIPKALEAATAILMHYVETKEALYTQAYTDDKLKKEWTFTHCQEKLSNNIYRAAVGGFTFSKGTSLAQGLYIQSRWDESGHEEYGVGCCRNF